MVSGDTASLYRRYAMYAYRKASLCPPGRHSPDWDRLFSSANESRHPQHSSTSLRLAPRSLTESSTVLFCNLKRFPRARQPHWKIVGKPSAPAERLLTHEPESRETQRRTSVSASRAPPDPLLFWSPAFLWPRRHCSQQGTAGFGRLFLLLP